MPVPARGAMSPRLWTAPSCGCSTLGSTVAEVPLTRPSTVASLSRTYVPSSRYTYEGVHTRTNMVVVVHVHRTVIHHNLLP